MNTEGTENTEKNARQGGRKAEGKEQGSKGARNGSGLVAIPGAAFNRALSVNCVSSAVPWFAHVV